MISVANRLPLTGDYIMTAEEEPHGRAGMGRSGRSISPTTLGGLGDYDKGPGLCSNRASALWKNFTSDSQVTELSSP